MLNLSRCRKFALRFQVACRIKWCDSPIPDVERLGFGGGTDRIPDVERLGFLCDSSDSVVEGPGFCGRSTFSSGVARFQSGITQLQSGTTRFEWWEHVRSQGGATYKTLIIKDLLDFRVVIFTTLKSVKPLSIRQLRDAPLVSS